MSATTTLFSDLATANVTIREKVTAMAGVRNRDFILETAGVITLSGAFPLLAFAAALLAHAVTSLTGGWMQSRFLLARLIGVEKMIKDLDGATP